MKKKIITVISLILSVFMLMQSVALAKFDSEKGKSGKNTPVIGTGTGLKGEYFDNINLTNLKLTRIDPTIDFNWNSGAPDGSIAKGTYSVRWTGQIQPEFSEEYTFYIHSGDGAILWINNKLLIVDLGGGASEKRASIFLQAGKKYDIRYEFYQIKGSAIAKLSWNSKSQKKEVIPKSQLYPPIILNIPQNLNAELSEKGVTLSWSKVDYATGYDVEIEGKAVKYNGNSTEFIDSNQAPGTRYVYRVRAKLGEIVGEWSQPVSIVTLLNIPTNLVAVPTQTDIFLTWETVEGATGYEIEADGLVMDTGSELTFIDKDLEAATEHTYRVRAKTESAISDWSPPLKVNTIMKPPAVPSNIRTVPAETSIALTWDVVDTAEGYEVEADGSVVDNGTSTSYLQNGLAPGSRHTYRIRAKNEGGEGEWSVQLTAITTVKVPESLAGESSRNEINLKWDAVNGATGYEIEADGVIKAVGNVVTYVDKELQANTEHTYRVRAITDVTASEWSEPIKVKTLMNPPAIPINISSISAETSIILSWDEVDSAAGYEVEADGKVISTGRSITYLHEGLQPGSQHIYRVRAKNEGGESEWSPMSVVATMLKVPAKLVGVPSTNQISLSWEAVNGASGYEIEADGVVKSIAGVSYIDKSLQPGTEHTYRVRAKTNAAVSMWSELIKVKTILNPPGVPANFRAVTQETSITLYWGAPATATGYDIEVDGGTIYSVTTTTFIHNGLEPGTQHSYRIRAKNASGLSNWSALLVKSTYLPSIDIESAFAMVDASSIQIEWDPVNGATGYDIEVDGIVVENLLVPIYLHEGLLLDSTHAYRMRAKNSVSTSKWTPIFEITTFINDYQDY